MKYKGITYDIGTEYSPDNFSRVNVTEEIIRKDMHAIKNELNCNSVRIYGKDPGILIKASEIALNSGLHVWISPRLIDGNANKTLDHIKEIASAFELLRTRYFGQELVFIIGAEISIDMIGYLKGDHISDRISNLLNPLFFIKNAIGINPKYQKSFNQFLKTAVESVKRVFKGKITYAGAMWEKVNWEDFDFVSMNLYRASFNKSFYNKLLKKLTAEGKPVIITEFGCCSYSGAEEKGPMGHNVLDFSRYPPVFREKCIRNEKVQADYIYDLLQIYDQENITGAFVFDFYSQHSTYNQNPEADFDKASYSITKSIGNNEWERKEAFYKISEYYGDSNSY